MQRPAPITKIDLVQNVNSVEVEKSCSTARITLSGNIMKERESRRGRERERKTENMLYFQDITDPGGGSLGAVRAPCLTVTRSQKPQSYKLKKLDSANKNEFGSKISPRTSRKELSLTDIYFQSPDTLSRESSSGLIPYC